MENAVRRNSGIDILKTICILFVIVLHTELLSSIFGINFEPLCRFATPMFFVITGYYYNNTVNLRKTTVQIKRVIFLILVANAVIILLNVIYCFCSKTSVTEWVLSIFSKKKIFDFLVFNSSIITGHFMSYHLWYLYALLYVLIIAGIIRKLGMFKVLYFLTPVLLAGGLIVECFSKQIFGVDFTASHGYCYYRNFLTIGIPYFCIGNLIRLYGKKIKLKNGIFLILSAIFWVLSVLENRIAATMLNISSMDFFISTPLCVVCIFILFNNCFQNKNLNNLWFFVSAIGRNCVVWIYIFHLPILVLVQDRLPKTNSIFADKALVTVITLALSLIIAALTDKIQNVLKSGRMRK